MGRAIAIATPVFFALIGLEYAWGRLRGRNTYRLNDAVNSLSLGVLSQLRTCSRSCCASVSTRSRGGTWRSAAAGRCLVGLGGGRDRSTTSATTGTIGSGHESAIFWAAHVVHHQSQEFNLSTALRQTSSGALLGWVFYLPMAVAGFPPQVFAVAALIDLLYQYWIHTEHVGRLGVLDRVLATPSNHRVHHAVNDRYLDRNYGGILIVWDRLFGSFAPETSAACTARVRRSSRGTRSGPTSRSTPTWRASPGAHPGGRTS